MKCVLIYVDKINKQKIYYDIDSEKFYANEYSSTSNYELFLLLPLILGISRNTEQLMYFNVSGLVAFMITSLFILFCVFYIKKTQTKIDVKTTQQISMYYLKSEIMTIKKQYRGNLLVIILMIICSLFIFMLYLKNSYFIFLYGYILCLIPCILILKDYNFKKVKGIIGYINKLNE